MAKTKTKMQTKTKPKAQTRAKSGTYWLYGRHAAQAALENPQRQVRRILVAARELPGWLPAAYRAKAEAVEATQIARHVGEQAVHQGIALEVDPLAQPHLEELLPATPPLVLLDQISDPQNIGAMLRSAAAFGVRALVLPKDHAPGESAAMAKTASGALERVALISVTNLAQTMETLKEAGYWLAGLEAGGRADVEQLAQHRPLALVLGAEGRGLRRLTRERCDVLAHIPMRGGMESLNVSAAAAIAMYEMQKCRKESHECV